MEMLQNPVVIIFLFGSALTFTIWLLRLEGVIKTMERDQLRLEKHFEDHEKDESIHHPEESLTEFKNQFEKRFDQLGRMVEKSNDELKAGLKDMNVKLDSLAVKRNST
jgi:biopolymer transport protein ExbB/TolQ